MRCFGGTSVTDTTSFCRTQEGWHPKMTLAVEIIRQHYQDNCAISSFCFCSMASISSMGTTSASGWSIPSQDSFSSVMCIKRNGEKFWGHLAFSQQEKKYAQTFPVFLTADNFRPKGICSTLQRPDIIDSASESEVVQKLAVHVTRSCERALLLERIASLLGLGVEAEACMVLDETLLTHVQLLCDPRDVALRDENVTRLSRAALPTPGALETKFAICEL